MNKWRSIARYTLMGFIVLTLAGCGTTSKSTDTPAAGGGGGGGTPAPSYVGTASLSGSVLVSQADANKVANSTTSNAVSILSVKALRSSVTYNSIKSHVLSVMKPYLYSGLSNPEIIIGGEARLYALNGDGTTTFTGITDNVISSNYEFTKIKDGTQYIVEIVKIGYDENNQRNILKLKAPAYIPAAVNGIPVSASAEISPKTKYAVDMIIDKVVKKAQSKNLDQDTINLIVQIVAETINDLLTNGTLTLPPSTVTYVASENVKVELAESSDADKAVMETISNDQDVQLVQQQATAKATMGKSMTDMTDEEIKSFLSQILNGAPDVFLSEFAKSYRLGKKVTITKMVDSYYDSLTPGMKLTAGHEVAAKLFLNARVVGKVNASLGHLYHFYDLATTNVNVIPSADVRDMAPVLSAIFPDAARLLNIDALTELNVPQGLVVFSMIMPKDSGMGILGKLYSDPAFSPYAPVGWQSQQNNGPGFDPLAFCSALGWMTLDAAKVYIEHIEVNVNKQMFPANFFDNALTTSNMMSGAWVPTQLLNVNVGVMLPPQFVGTVNAAEIEYTDEGNVVRTVQLIRTGILGNNNNGNGGGIGFGLNAWEIQNYFNATGDKTYISRIIRSFKTGIATVRIKNGDTVLATEIVNIVNPILTNVSFIYPKGPDMELVAKLGWDNNFTPEDLPVNDNGKANPRFQWEAPIGDIPAGYSLAYSVELRETVNKYNPQTNSWTPPARFAKWQGNSTTNLTNMDNFGSRTVFSSWESGGRLIHASEFSLPTGKELEATTKNIALNYQTKYEFVVTPVLVKDGTDNQLWQGAQARTEFYVTSIQWTLALHGNIAFPKKSDLEMKLDAGLKNADGIWKVGLFRTSGNEPGSWMRKEYYTDNTILDAREPVSSVIALGSMSDVATTSVQFVAYAMDAIKKSTHHFVNNSEYDLVLWYDISTGNRVDDAIDVAQNLNNAYMINFREPQYRFGLHIQYRDGRLEYWQDGTMAIAGMMNNKDLTIPEYQIIDFDLAAKVGQYYMAPGMPNAPVPPVYVFPPANPVGTVDTSMINTEFWRDGTQNKIIFKTFWDMMANSAPTLNIGTMHYVKLVRDWDKKVIATGNPTAVFSTTGLANELQVSMGAFEMTDVSQNAIVPDNYYLCVYDTETPTAGTQPVYKTGMKWVDSWFINGDSGMNNGGGMIFNPPPQGNQPVIQGTWKKSGSGIVSISTFMPLNKDIVTIVITNEAMVTQCSWDNSLTPFFAGEGGAAGALSQYYGAGSGVVGTIPTGFVTGNYFIVGLDRDGGIVFGVRRDGSMGTNPYMSMMQGAGDQGGYVPPPGGGNYVAPGSISGNYTVTNNQLVITFQQDLPGTVDKVSLRTMQDAMQCNWVVNHGTMFGVTGNRQIVIPLTTPISEGVLPGDIMAGSFFIGGGDGMHDPWMHAYKQQGGGQPSGNAVGGTYSTTGSAMDIMLYPVSALPKAVIKVFIADVTDPNNPVPVCHWDVNFVGGVTPLAKNSVIGVIPPDLMTTSKYIIAGFNADPTGDPNAKPVFSLNRI